MPILFFGEKAWQRIKKYVSRDLNYILAVVVVVDVNHARMNH